MSTPVLREALDAATEALESLGLRYALIGGLAVSVWSAARATQDIDLYADLPVERRPDIRQALMLRGFDVPAMDEELERFGVFRSLFRPTDVFVDVFDADNPIGEAILSRRREVKAEGKVRWTAAPEDLVILKAFSDRPRDFEDLMKLVAVREPMLDMDYVERWARELDRSIGGDEVSERLRQARAGAVKPKPRT